MTGAKKLSNPPALKSAEGSVRTSVNDSSELAWKHIKQPYQQDSQVPVSTSPVLGQR